MPTEGRRHHVLPLALAATLLLWPAIWNGYPLVFSDTGTYLTQAIERYVGWDRPVFYSLFLFPLHLTLTTWPAIAVQALLAAHLIHLTSRVLLPDASCRNLPALVAVLAAASSLPWFASQLVPDIFTGLLVLVLALLVFAPDQLTRAERAWLMVLATFLIAVHQSHVPLALVLLLVLLPLRRRLGGAVLPSAMLLVAAPLMLAIGALVAVNLAAFGRASPSPFGNVFLLARVIYDGPGMTVLQRDCPQAGWRLCDFRDSLPASADLFLWHADGPVARAGGAKQVSLEASAIIRSALIAQPGRELIAVAGNTVRQLAQFATGDGLEAWPATVTPKIERHFPPREFATYAASRQARGALDVPAWLRALHGATSLAGVAACAWFLMSPRRHPTLAGFAAAVLLALVVNAAITGGLSGPHDRYQSRVMWLPPLIAVLGVVSLRRTHRSDTRR